MKTGYLIIAMTFLIISVLTNPNLERHKEVITYKLNLFFQKESKNAEESDDLDNQDGMILNAVIKDLIDNSVSVDNYIVFSISKISIGSTSKTVGIGAFGNVYISNLLDFIKAAYLKPNDDKNTEKEKKDEVKRTTSPSSESNPKLVKTNTPTEKVMVIDDPDALAIKRQKEETKRREKAQKDAERREREEEEAEERRVANEKAKYSQSKSKYGDMFKNGGSGRDNQDNTLEDQNAEILTRSNTGTGSIGGGLQNRGGAGPKINAKFSDEGIVAIKICVGSSGNVISAAYTQSGSNTTNSNLINIARDNAKRYGFKSSDIDRQCGTITYNFSLK